MFSCLLVINRNRKKTNDSRKQIDELAKTLEICNGRVCVRQEAETHLLVS